MRHIILVKRYIVSYAGKEVNILNLNIIARDNKTSVIEYIQFNNLQLTSDSLQYVTKKREKIMYDDTRNLRWESPERNINNPAVQKFLENLKTIFSKADPKLGLTQIENNIKIKVYYFIEEKSNA